MEGYLGDFPVETLEGTPYEAFSPTDWAMYYIFCYGGIDGEHHKQWVLDQVARILKGTPVVVRQARWANGHTEYRFSTAEPSEAYQAWVRDAKGSWDEEGASFEYDWDEGVAP
jgi:hypothetical protein